MAPDIYLAGSEDVRRAASEMTAASNNMLRAAGEINHAVDRLERLLADLPNLDTPDA